MVDTRRKRLGLIAFVTILTMTAPIGTDLYLPALPEMTEYFGTTSTVASLTVTLFFVFMAIGTLLLGAISDRFGRRPVLLASVLTALAFSLICAFAPNIELLLAARSLQAFGCGGMMVMATAIVRDSFEGRDLVKVLSVTHAMIIIAPILAPSVGALIVHYADWRMTFVALAGILTVSFLLSLLFRETLPAHKRTSRGPLRSIAQLAAEVRDVRFAMLILVGGFITSPFKAYLANASYIYIEGFGVSEPVFGLYFAVCAAASVMGPALNLRVQSVPVTRVFAFGYAILFLCGALLMTVGVLHPVAFLLCFIPVSTLNALFRPYVSGIMLAMKSENIGAASAVMNFGFTVIGSLGMLFAALPWGSYIHGVSYNIFVFVGLSLVFWIISLKTGLLRFPPKAGAAAPEPRTAKNA